MFRLLLLAAAAVAISACMPGGGNGIYDFIKSNDPQVLAKRYGQAEAFANDCGHAVSARQFRALAQKELALLAKDAAALGANAEPTWGTYMEAYKGGMETMRLPGASADCDSHLQTFYQYLEDVKKATAERAAKEQAR